MTDIEMVIKIPEDCLKELKCVELNESNEGVVFHAIKCILNGIPLPKGQGKLIERVLNAAEALKQKPRFILHSDGKFEQIIEHYDVVLDKIKDEIFDIDDETVLNPDSFYERKVYVRRSKVIDIIDKYKTESEAAE